MFTPNLGVEAGWVDLGKATDSATIEGEITVSGNVELKAASPFIAGIAAAPIESGSVFGEVGLANVKSELTVSVLGVSDSESRRHTDVFYGIGAGYNFTKNLGVRVEWERFRIKYNDGLEDIKDNVDLLSVGVTYSF